MTTLRDPRAFKVLEGKVSFPRSDEVLAAIQKGDRPQGYAIDEFHAGRTIPPGRLPASAASVFVARGVVVPVEPPTPAKPAVAKDAPAVAPAPRPAPQAPIKKGGDA